MTFTDRLIIGVLIALAPQVWRPGIACAQTKPAAQEEHLEPFYLPCSGATQFCDGVYEIAVQTTSRRPTIRYTTAATHCSRLRVRVSVDGNEVATSPFLDPGKDTGAIPLDVPPGRHTIRIAPEGTVGGCNSGSYSSWGGTVTSTGMIREDAKTLATAINKAGRAEVYGILFDLDKTTLKPESRATLIEVSRLLKSDPALRLEVAGHTDNTGSKEHNAQLSAGRAEAVVKALVSEYGVDASRLQPKGYGDTKPVAPNNSEANRAKNRRVGLRKL